MAVAIEDAGFEIRDMVNWVYRSGFPKSHDTSKAIDKSYGAKRQIIGKSSNGLAQNWFNQGDAGFKKKYDLTAPTTEEAKTWQGWGTALKPSHEDICLAQKPYTTQQNINIIGSYIARTGGPFMVNVICECCGKGFWVKPTKLQRGVRFCSMECRRESPIYRAFY